MAEPVISTGVPPPVSAAPPNRLCWRPVTHPSFAKGEGGNEKADRWERGQRRSWHGNRDGLVGRAGLGRDFANLDRVHYRPILNVYSR